MSRLNSTLKSPINWSSMARVATVGAVGTSLDWATFTGLSVLLGLPAVTANTVSSSIGMLNGFVLNRRWTFAGRPQGALRTQLARFLLVNLASLLLNSLIVSLLAGLLNTVVLFPSSGNLLAKAGAGTVTACLTFAANSLWTFRDLAGAA